MHGLISYIRLSEMLEESKNCPIKPLFAYFTISLSNANNMNK